MWQAHSDWYAGGNQGPSPWDLQWLAGKRHNVHSQNGEDGLIRAILEQIGIATSWCVDIGASDGRKNSNTAVLRQAGWQCLLIDKSPLGFQLLASDDVRCVVERVSPENVNDLLADCPEETDFLSLDIDGNDYHVWRAMQLRPRVVCVEFNPNVGDGETWIVPDAEAHKQEVEYKFANQATLAPILALGYEKGYDIAACTFCNAIFVRKELL